MLLLLGGTLLGILAFAQFDFSFEKLASAAVAVHENGDAIVAPSTMLEDPIQAISFVLGACFGLLGLPYILMRFFTVPNAVELRKSAVYASGFIGYFFLVICILGLGGIAIVSANPEFFVGGDLDGQMLGGGNMVALHLAKATGGNLLLGFLPAVAFAAILAVVSGLVLAGAAAVSHDLYANVLRKGTASEAEEVRVTRIATIAIGVVAVVLGILFKGQNLAFLVALEFDIAASLNFPILFLSMYWTGLTTCGAVVGGITGLVLAVMFVVLGPAVWVTALGHSEPIFPYDYPTLFSMSAAFFAAWIVSRLDRSPRARAEIAAFDEQEVRAQTGLGAAAVRPGVAGLTHKYELRFTNGQHDALTHVASLFISKMNSGSRFAAGGVA